MLLLMCCDIVFTYVDDCNGCTRQTTTKNVSIHKRERNYKAKTKHKNVNDISIVPTL